MPLVLRKIRKARWYWDQPLAWLPQGDIPADPLADLSTSANQLSVWLVNDDRSNLEMVAAAMAASCNSISNLDYALVREETLPGIAISMKATKGGTLDEAANTAWHRDLVELSAAKLVGLAKAIVNEGNIVRIPEKRILQLIAASVGAGRIDRGKLDPKIQAKLDRALPNAVSTGQKDAVPSLLPPLKPPGDT